MKHLVRSSAAAVVCLFLLSGCALVGQSTGGTSASSTPTASAEATASADATANADGAFAVTFSCRLADSKSFEETTSVLADIWALGDEVTQCTGKSNGGTKFTAAEQEAIDTLGPAAQGANAKAGADDARLVKVYELCAMPGFYFAVTPGISSDEQAGQVEAALGLCPEHPDASDATTSLETYRANAAAVADGTRFKDGTWKVGEQIKPGTYKPESPSDTCRWFRNDADGSWIATSYDRPQTDYVVTIEATDATFESRNCGTWVAA